MKPIKILGINSSPRRKSGPAQQESSTRLLLSHALNYVRDRSDTEIVDLVEFDFAPTEGCYSSDENLCQVGFDHYDDDANRVIFEKIVAADGVIFSSPVYWLGMSSRLSALFERMTELDPIVRDPTKRLLQGKVAGAIATAQLDGAAEVCYDILKKANYMGFVVPPHAFALHVLGQTKFTLENKEALANDFVAFWNAERLSENVLKMCCLLRNTSKEYWSPYFELTRPLSDLEARHVFDEKAEQDRVRRERLFNKNRDGLI